MGIYSVYKTFIIFIDSLKIIFLNVLLANCEEIYNSFIKIKRRILGKLINKNSSIFVAGHGGMVGSSLVRVLKKNGYTNIITAERNFLDLTNYQDVKEWFKAIKPEVVLLAAAKVGGIYANNEYPTEFLFNNIKIQTNVIENAWKSGTKRLLFLGSSCIYPKNTIQPIKEEYLLSSELEKTNEWYAIAKISGIKMCDALWKQYKFDCISLMPTNLYGPGDNYHHLNSHVIAALINKIYEAKLNSSATVNCWGSGLAKREFLYVDDLGECCLFALENWSRNQKNSPKDDNGQNLSFLNVGTGSEISIKDLVKFLAEIIGYKGKFSWDKSKPDGTLLKRLDCSRIHSLGWQHKVELKKGLEFAYLDYIKNKSSNSLREK